MLYFEGGLKNRQFRKESSSPLTVSVTSTPDFQKLGIPSLLGYAIGSGTWRLHVSISLDRADLSHYYFMAMHC